MPTGGNAAYTKALQVLDTDMPQYISDNTEDELSHEHFINAYLAFKGAEMVNLDKFRILHGSQATGANKNFPRLTNLKQLTVDTTWWTRYRSGAKILTSATLFSRRFRLSLRASTPPFPAVTPTTPRTAAILFRRSPIRLAFISPLSNKAARAFIHSWRNEPET